MATNKLPVKIHEENLIMKVRDTVLILQIFRESRLNFASWIRNRDQLFPSSYYLFGSPDQVLHGSWTVKVNSKEEEEEKARFSILAPLPPPSTVSPRKLGRKVYVTRDKLEEDED